MPITPDHTHTIISVKDVAFAYGSNQVLARVNLDIHQGDYLGIVGPNGGGKTTLLKLILGLLKPDQGEITLFGEKVAQFKDWFKVSYVAQKATNFDRFFPVSVEDVVGMGRLAHHTGFSRLGTYDQQAIATALKQVGLTALKKRLIGDLSGGQQQRVFIARALAQQAEVIFLDEPTTGVDETTQEEFYTLLRKLNRELGITLIIVSHEQDVVRNEVTEVACVNQHVNYHGPAEDFLKSTSADGMFGTHMKAIHHHHA